MPSYTHNPISKEDLQRMLNHDEDNSFSLGVVFFGTILELNIFTSNKLQKINYLDIMITDYMPNISIVKELKDHPNRAILYVNYNGWCSDLAWLIMNGHKINTITIKNGKKEWNLV